MGWHFCIYYKFIELRFVRPFGQSMNHRQKQQVIYIVNYYKAKQQDNFQELSKLITISPFQVRSFQTLPLKYPSGLKVEIV